MKKLASFIMLVFFASTIFAQASNNGHEIKFEKTVHEYGNILQGDNGVCEFIFKNVGNEPLVLSNVASSCGCTVPEWPKTPILPNQSATIKVKYNTGNVGTISKNVTVFSNASTDRVTLQLRGNVVAKPAETIPEKAQNTLRP